MTKIQTAMILSAGFGKRMGELTHNKPKPAIEIFGKSFIHRIFDMLLEHGVSNVVVNSHYLADALFSHIQSYSRLDQITIDFIYEEEILETAGGVINAQKYIKGEDFFLINGDVLFYDFSKNPLAILENFYVPTKMDLLILLQPKDKVYGYFGKGDFELLVPQEKCEVLVRNEIEMPYVHVGAYIAKKSVFSQFSKGFMKMMDLFKLRMQPNNSIEKFYGVVGDGFCFHIGDKKSYYELEKFTTEKNIKL